jgi:hypothetical protein
MLLDNMTSYQITDDLLAGVQRKAKKPVWKKTVENILRKVGFFALSIIFRWPIWLMLGICRLAGIKFFDYLFLVYPGTDKDLDGYCPRWLAKSWIFRNKPVIGGVISKGSGGRGLILVVPNTVVEFRSNKDVCEKIIHRLNWIKELVGAKSIALAGQVPGIIVRHGIELVEPFVRGNKGTVFCVSEAIREVMKKHKLTPGQFNIVVLGVGYVGGVLMSFLKEEGYKVIGIGIKPRPDTPEILAGADMVVVLLPRGEDFAPYARYIRSGTIVIDDTHPKIHKRPNDFFFYKVAVGIKGVKFFPRLPGYKADWIPGCAVEAIVSAATGNFNGTSQVFFNQKARELGFYAHLAS